MPERLSVIDGSGTEDVVAKKVWTAVKARLE
jgi:hypothetical protein